MNNPWGGISVPGREFKARRVDSEHPLDLYWARDDSGHYLFIYEFEKANTTFDPKDLPVLNGIQSDFASADGSPERMRLALLLNEESNWEIFLAVCNDLVQTTRLLQTSSEAILKILGRLEHWQEFLKKPPTHFLTEPEIIGLLGELLFIKDYLIPRFGAAAAVPFWNGPKGSIQDFEVNESAVEVKCKLGTATPLVQISSANQLCSRLPHLFLAVFTINRSERGFPGAVNLVVVIRQIREALDPEPPALTDDFSDLLRLAGYIDSEYYEDFNYLPAGIRVFRVTDEFPRICPEELRPGVSNVTYSIDLVNCAEFEQQPDWMDVH